MVNLEHIRLLETRISKAIDYVRKINDENLLLKERLSSYQTRIEELEVLVQQFKEEQNRIEDGILSALDRLNQFEDALENKLAEKQAVPVKKPAPKTAKPEQEAQVSERSSVPESKPAPPPAVPDPDDDDIEQETDLDAAEDMPEDDGELDIF